MLEPRQLAATFHTGWHNSWVKKTAKGWVTVCAQKVKVGRRLG